MIAFIQFLFFNKKGLLYYTLPLLLGFGLIALGWTLGYRYHLFMLTYHGLIGYDKVLHTLGGSWWALFGIALYDFHRGAFDRFLLGLTREKETHLARNIMRSAILWAFMIGAGWEALEASWPWLRDYFPTDPVDTVMDIVFDVIGGSCIGWYYSKRLLVPMPLPAIEVTPEQEIEK